MANRFVSRVPWGGLVGGLLLAVTVALFAAMRGDLPSEGISAPDEAAPSDRAERRKRRRRAEEPAAPPEDGKWHRFNTHRFDASLTEEQRAEIEALEAIGYVDGTTEREVNTVVPIHDRERAFQGYNLYASGHDAEAVLTDMDGAVLHRWNADFWEVWPDYPARKGEPGTNHWRRVFLLDDGGLIGIFEGKGILRLDRDSNVVWANPDRAHHDLALLPDGRMWVLAREAGMVPRIDADQPILEDHLALLGADGEEIRRFSLLEALERSPWAEWIDTKAAENRDIFHTNAVERLDGSLASVDPAFAAGNLLVSSRTLSFVGVVDPERGVFVWASKGEFRKQHDPTITPQGTMLVFDNSGGRRGARVLELSVPSLETVWSYEGTDEVPFRSPTLGTAARLPNGNTLVTESEGGRAFEVTTDGTIVWEMYNPNRAGDAGQYIASLFEVVRIPLEPKPAWLEGG